MFWVEQDTENSMAHAQYMLHN